MVWKSELFIEKLLVFEWKIKKVSISPAETAPENLERVKNTREGKAVLMVVFLAKME